MAVINILFYIYAYQLKSRLSLRMFSTTLPQMYWTSGARILFIRVWMKIWFTLGMIWFCFIWLLNDNIRELNFSKFWETAREATGHAFGHLCIRDEKARQKQVTYLLLSNNLSFSIALFPYRLHLSLLSFLFLIILTLTVGEIDDPNTIYNLYK